MKYIAKTYLLLRSFLISFSDVFEILELITPSRCQTEGSPSFQWASTWEFVQFLCRSLCIASNVCKIPVMSFCEHIEVTELIWTKTILSGFFNKTAMGSSKVIYTKKKEPLRLPVWYQEKEGKCEGHSVEDAVFLPFNSLT